MFFQALVTCAFTSTCAPPALYALAGLLNCGQSSATLIVPGRPAPGIACLREVRVTESVVPLYRIFTCALLRGVLVLHCLYPS